MGLNLHNPCILGVLNDVPFDPNSISNLRAWFDVSDADNVTRTDENITTLTDKTGNGNSISQGNGARKPHWIDAVQNGLPIARFTTSDDLSRNSLIGFGTQPNTVFIVCKMPSSVSSGVKAWVFNSAGPGNDDQAFFRDDTADDTNGYGISAGSDLIDATEAIDETNILLYTLVFDGVSSSITKSGVEIESGDAGTSVISGITLNTNEAISIRSGGMDVGEFLLYNKALTTQEETDVENYLNSKWGL